MVDGLIPSHCLIDTRKAILSLSQQGKKNPLRLSSLPESAHREVKPFQRERSLSAFPSSSLWAVDSFMGGWREYRNNGSKEAGEGVKGT